MVSFDLDNFSAFLRLHLSQGSSLPVPSDTPRRALNKLCFSDPHLLLTSQGGPRGVYFPHLVQNASFSAPDF